MTIAIDFDGTIAQYDRYRGKGIFGLPIDGAIEKINRLASQGNIIIINTTRIEKHDVAEYLKLYGIHYDYINYNPENDRQMLSHSKVLADVYIDDRNIEFNGEWNDDLIAKINNFKPHWRK